MRAHARDLSPVASLSQKAYLHVRAKILSGELALGAALSRRKLAVELNMSFLPISEALQRLEAEGLLESKPRVGTRVRVPDARDIEDRYIMREALETQAARLFAERSTKEEKKEICRMGKHLDGLYKACESISVDRAFLFSVHTYHMNLHMKIAECARCQTLRDAIENQQVLIFNWLFDTAAQQRTLPSNFHAILTRALASGRPAEADDVMRQHIRHGFEEVKSRIGSLGETLSGWRLKRLDNDQPAIKSA